MALKEAEIVEVTASSATAEQGPCAPRICLPHVTPKPPPPMPPMPPPRPGPPN